MKLVVVVLSLLVVSIVNSAENFHKDGSNYYVSYPDTANWFQAMRFCTYNGMYLIDVRTDFENQRILSIINTLNSNFNLTHTNFWTSGTDLGSQGQHYWATTGHQFLFTKWGSSEPTGANERCVHFYGPIGHKWNDNNCDVEFYFICRDTFDVPVYKNKECSTLLRDSL